MNTYRTEFFAKCPVNGCRIHYRLRVDAQVVIAVEKIIAATEHIEEGLHESIADLLFSRLGGVQTLTADHHSVVIETIRDGHGESHFLDQSVPGMAGTPGY